MPTVYDDGNAVIYGAKPGWKAHKPLRPPS